MARRIVSSLRDCFPGAPVRYNHSIPSGFGNRNANVFLCTGEWPRRSMAIRFTPNTKYATLSRQIPENRFFCVRIPGRGLSQRGARNDHALDFAGAFADGHQARVPVHALDGVFAAVAVPAVDLDGIVADTLRHFRGESFAMAASLVYGRFWSLSQAAL